ncbi:MAG: hypothetical protein P9L92_11520 [Candidatus Electryonea clarkiae]|nr:hypothetical protein [Candidatus Electryonea clarkiae]MDP8288325.1 hypothetical protein [Candidatus Electryonea clarkiae]
MTEEKIDSLDDFRKEPWRLVDVARIFAVEGTAPPDSLEAILTGSERVMIHDVLSASVSLWDLLASTKRHIGLIWLDKTGLLNDLFPCWGGNPARRAMRLLAIEQVHLETWKEGLSEQSITLICDQHDMVVDGRLNGWALTALATLLAGGDTENQYFWSKMVRRNLYELGATEAEIIWIENIVTEYRKAVHMVRGETEAYTLTPQLAVTILSTMRIAGEDSSEEILQASKRVDDALKQQANPMDQ